MKLDTETLVDLVVARAVVDKTAPDSANSRNGWRTDELLRDVDEFVVIQGNEPAAYAEIARQVLANVHDLPEIAALVRLAIFRGERLLPIDFIREQSLAEMADKLMLEITALPDGPRKMRCKELLEYHVGVFSEVCGRFDVAAEMYARAAADSERLGDKPRLAINSFRATVCSLKDALIKGQPDDASALFSSVEEAFAELVKATSGTTFQVQWAEDIGPVHALEASIWLDQIPDEWEHWAATLATTGKLAEVYEHDAKFAQAVQMALHGDPAADEALSVIADTGTDDELKATALLILARRALRAGNKDLAKDIVGRMPEKDAHHVRAVAGRLLLKE